MPLKAPTIVAYNTFVHAQVNEPDPDNPGETQVAYFIDARYATLLTFLSAKYVYACTRSMRLLILLYSARGRPAITPGGVYDRMRVAYNRWQRGESVW